MKTEIFNTREEAVKIKTQYENIGMVSHWHKESSTGKYVVTTWKPNDNN